MVSTHVRINMLALVLAAVLSIVAPAGHVNDLTGSLTPAQTLALENKLRDYENETKNEIAILAVPSLPVGETIESYANKVFHEWGIGKKGVDNGVLLLWSKGDRKIRIEVGYGMEPSLPDGRAGQIIREEIAPKFRSSDWFGGLEYGTAAIISQLEMKRAEAAVNAQSSSPPPPDDFELSWIWILVLIGGIVAFIAFLFWLFRDREAKSERSVRYYDPDPYIPPSRPSSSSYVVSAGTTKKSSSSSSRSSSSPSYIPVPYDSGGSSWGSSSSSSWDSGSSSSSFGGFGGGDSGGGGASGDY
jgi:uncharacterized protein